MTERQNKRGGLVAGIILIAFGCLFLLDRFVVVDLGDLIHDYWPMIIVVIGALKLSEPRGAWSGLWMIAVGAWLQLAHLELFGITYRNSWPLLLIALGAGMVARALLESMRSKEEKPHES